MKSRTRTLLAYAALIGLACAGGCKKQHSSRGEDKAGDGPERSGKQHRIVLASADKAEAREWMKGATHLLFKADPKKVAQFVEEFYSAGAVQVLIAEVQEREGKQFGEALLVVLPKDTALRAKLFSIGNRADEAFQNDPVTESGQDYLYYWLD